MFRHVFLRSASIFKSWRKLSMLSLLLALLFSVVHLLPQAENDDIVLKSRKTLQSSSKPFEGYKDCHAASKVAFLKTHKCASSSVQNLLLRRAAKYSLNVALPLTGNYVGRYMSFHRSTLWGTPWSVADLDYNLFCLHTIWNQEEVELVMGPDALYFSILRDPVDLFVSLWDYVQLSSYYNVSLEDYILHANKSSGAFRDRGKVTNLGRNQMLWDFGLPAQFFDDDEKVKEKIANIESRFDLMLIAEQFDESIVLLKDLLCWDFVDMTHFKINARKDNAKSGISDRAREELAKWLKADYMLYNHFKARFDKEMERFGRSRMEQELRILRAANKNVAERCAISATDNDQLTGSEKLWGKDLIGYKVNETGDEFCRFFGLSEMSFLDYLRGEQTERARAALAAQNRTLEAELAGLADPQRFQPAAVTKEDGSPDIERLKAIFGHRKVP